MFIFHYKLQMYWIIINLGVHEHTIGFHLSYNIIHSYCMCLVSFILSYGTMLHTVQYPSFCGLRPSSPLPPADATV